MSETPIDWTQFTVAQHVKAPIEKVFAAWTVPSEMEKWFSTKTARVKDGVEIAGKSEPFNVGDKVLNIHGAHECNFTQIVEYKKNEYIKFYFDSDKVVVEIWFSEIDGFTKVTLKQSNMSDSMLAIYHWHMSCKVGWTNFLHNLKSYYEYQIDMREPDLSKNIFYGD